MNGQRRPHWPKSDLGMQARSIDPHLVETLENEAKPVKCGALLISRPTMAR